MKDFMFAKDDMLPVMPEPSVDNEFRFAHKDKSDKSPVTELYSMFSFVNA